MAKLSTEDFFHMKKGPQRDDEPTTIEVKSDDRRRKSSRSTGGGPKKKQWTLPETNIAPKNDGFQ